MMSIVSKSILILRKAAALMLLPLLAWSCQLVTDDFDDETANISNATQYINITISVSASESPVTRANPTGGEYGDGWEMGIEDRENSVSNITLIFFKDAAGVNTTNTNTEVLYVKKYNVHEATLADYYYPRDYYYHTHKATEPKTGYYNQEIIYTTGDQPLEENTIEAGETYQVLVVANADPDIRVGDKINSTQTDGRAAVRDMVLNHAFTIADGNIVNVSNFVMASESPASVTLNNPTVISDENKAIYYFDCIHIERLAARIDYWAENSNGFKTSVDNAAYTTAGYEYTVKKPNGDDGEDRFVLTSITPFNLNMGGNEFLFKRTNDATNPYLADETLTNWVVDPYTASKTTSGHPSYLQSTLSDVTTNMAGTYNITMAAQQSNKLTIGSSDDIILAYPMENTLSPSVTPLYYYATGLAFEGYYYWKGTGTGERRVYYYFIRHQGEQDTAYEAYTSTNISSAVSTLCPATPAMNYGIVRNNIYRISVNRVTDGGTLQLKIAVHDWRNVLHPIIYI